MFFITVSSFKSLFFCFSEPAAVVLFPSLHPTSWLLLTSPAWKYVLRLFSFPFIFPLHLFFLILFASLCSFQPFVRSFPFFQLVYIPFFQRLLSKMCFPFIFIILSSPSRFPQQAKINFNFLWTFYFSSSDFFKHFSFPPSFSLQLELKTKLWPQADCKPQQKLFHGAEKRQPSYKPIDFVKLDWLLQKLREH